ncbi:MAG: PKD domain-containing protein [Terriglobales bacterium]
MQTNGNAASGNVSKVPLRSLLYSGSNTKIYVTWLGWFGKPDHMNVGYNSNSADQVHRQVDDMMSRGVQGAIAAWYGSANTVIDASTMLLRNEAESRSGQLEFAIMEDVGALGSAAKQNGCDVTDQLITDLTYVATQYESSSAYMRMNGRPVLFFFGVDAYYIDWNRVVSSIPGNPLLIFQGTSGLTRSISDGGFSWINITVADPFNLQLTAQDSFQQVAQSKPARLAFASAYKGFNDSLAAWGNNRLIDQHCGQTWLQTFSEVGKFYSSSDQLPGIQIATWNDYEEGTAIESGIDNCIYLTPSQSGASISWGVNGGDESTIDHYSVFISKDGANLAKVKDVPEGTHAVDLSALNLSKGAYFVYVEAIGKASFKNKMSPPIVYSPGDQPPGIVLKISQTGSLTYAASTAGSSANSVHSQIDFGDGTVIQGSSGSHTYGAVGTYLITASVYDAAGASAVSVQQISAKPGSSGITISSPANGSTVNWPTKLVASANTGAPIQSLQVLIDGKLAVAASGDTLNTVLKVFTGTHQLTVQSIDSAGTSTASASLNVVAEPDDLPPVAKFTLKALPEISPTTILGCTALSSDPDGFLSKQQVQYSDGSLFSIPGALETFPAAGTYKATTTVTDQFGAVNQSTTTFSVGGGMAPAAIVPSAPREQPQDTVPPMAPQ